MKFLFPYLLSYCFIATIVANGSDFNQTSQEYFDGIIPLGLNNNKEDLLSTRNKQTMTRETLKKWLRLRSGEKKKETRQRIHDQRYNIYSSDDLKFVWFRVFKAASVTIEDLLLMKVDDLILMREDDVPKQFKKYFKFAFVRNPWDRILSCYFQKVVTKKNPEFRECFDKDFGYFINYIDKLDLTVANSHIKPQTLLIPVEECDFIGRVDHFNEGLKYVCEQIGIDFDLNEVGHMNKTEHEHYSAYYKPWMVKIIAKKYKDDIETFGFEFEIKN